MVFGHFSQFTADDWIGDFIACCKGGCAAQDQAVDADQGARSFAKAHRVMSVVGGGDDHGARELEARVDPVYRDFYHTRRILKVCHLN